MKDKITAILSNETFFISNETFIKLTNLEYKTTLPILKGGLFYEKFEFSVRIMCIIMMSYFFIMLSLHIFTNP